LTVAIALDHSFSMAGPPLAAMKRGTRTFLGALRPGDETVVLGISSQVEVVARPNQARAEQIAAVDGLTAWGTTTLHDAILAAIESVDGARGRRALVILSDGDDRYSETSAAEATARAPKQGLLLFTAKGHDLFAAVGGSLRQDNDPKVIDRLWNPFVAAWYTGKDDPSLRLLRFDPDAAEIWLNDSSLLAGVKTLLGFDPKTGYEDKVATVKLAKG
jgi:general stress protein 26